MHQPIASFTTERGHYHFLENLLLLSEDMGEKEIDLRFTLHASSRSNTRASE
jgi:hypothetical protein